MTPAARIQAAIEILEDIRSGQPAEQALVGWARRSRFAGSKDRAAVRDHVFQAVRCWRSFAALGGAETGRGVMIGLLRSSGADLSEFFTGQGYAPAALTEEETKSGRPPENEGARLDLPDWLVPLFRHSLGQAADDTALALRERAPVMLRGNLRKAPLDRIIDLLSGDGITAHPHPIASTALIVTQGARRISGSAGYRDGLVELQDGSSQAAMETLDIPAGSRVMDYCAGGGGKTLALAARCNASWFVHDALPQRMKDLPNRAERAGAIVTSMPVAEEGAPYDLVLCDVPCSGSGTWRRTPDAKWRLTADRLAELNLTQDEILDKAGGIVAPKGTLVYATCSVFDQENEERVAAFLGRAPEWRIRAQQRWPVSDGGDGFYLAQLTRD